MNQQYEFMIELTCSTAASCWALRIWVYRGSWYTLRSPPLSDSLCRVRSAGSGLLQVHTDSVSSSFWTCGPSPSPSSSAGCFPERQPTEPCPDQRCHRHHLPHLQARDGEDGYKSHNRHFQHHYLYVMCVCWGGRHLWMPMPQLPNQSAGDTTDLNAAVGGAYTLISSHLLFFCPTSEPGFYSYGLLLAPWRAGHLEVIQG